MRIGIDARKLADFGIGTYVAGLLSGLAQLDQGSEDYVVFVPRRWRERVPAQFERIVTDVPYYSIRELFVIGRLLSKYAVDVFHAPHFVLPRTGVPCLATIHDLIPLHFPYRNPVARIYYETMLHRAIRKSARVLTVSETARRQLVDETRCDPSKAIAIANGIDPMFFEAHVPERSDRRYFLYVGNDKVHKNVDALVSAFAIVRKSEPDTRLMLTGAPFERFAAAAGVERTGFVSDVRLASLYRGAVALVIPSLEEGFGLPAVEALASGTAVITSMDPALLEVTGDAAMHVDARSADAIAGAMLRLARDERLRSGLAAKGPQHARRYSWRRCAELTRQVYRDVARR